MGKPIEISKKGGKNGRTEISLPIREGLSKEGVTFNSRKKKEELTGLGALVMDTRGRYFNFSGEKFCQEFYHWLGDTRGISMLEPALQSLGAVARVEQKIDPLTPQGGGEAQSSGCTCGKKEKKLRIFVGGKRATECIKDAT